MGLAGNLGEFHLGELLQVLSMGRKTGVVTIKGDVASGRLTLVSGRVVDAAIDDGGAGRGSLLRAAAATPAARSDS